MKNMARRSFSLLLALAICIGLLSGLTFTVSATDVDYVYSGSYIYNWGTREETATFLSPNAESFYEDNNVTYEDLAALSGSSTVSSVPNSALYKKLQNLMSSAQTYQTSYDATRSLFQYTDCQASGSWNSGKISSFYSGTAVGPAWDSGKTWNREHTWPNSKGLGGNDENDIMMLRPTSVSENSERSNIAYGESSSFYDPNTESNGAYNLHGDVARIALYVYVRWGNTLSMWGSSGVIESKEVLLKWMEEDPVDTWELGRNDSVEAITGTRNVFVDYPELAFVLFDAVIPADMQTPSGEASKYDFDVSAVSNNTAYGTVSLDGLTITATPAEGYVVDGYTVLTGTANVTQTGKTFAVAPKSDCTIQINFVEKSLCTVRFAENGNVTTTMTPYTGESVTMPQSVTTVDGYTFLGWSAVEVEATSQKPTYYAAGSTYEVTGETTFYALYTYGVAGTGNVFEKVTAAPSSWEGEYVITSSNPDTGANYVFQADGTDPGSAAAVKEFSMVGLSAEGDVLKGVTDQYVVVAEKVGSNYSLRLKGASSTLYLMTTNSNSGFSATSSTSSNQALWNFAFSNGRVVIRNAAYTSRTLQYNSGNTLFRTYTSTQQPLVLYKRSGTATEDFYSTLTGVAPCNHTETTTTTVAATCTANGSVKVTCNNCGTTISTQTIPMLAHSYHGVVTAPTCIKGGYTTYTCTACGDTYIGNETGTVDHSYVADVTPPTCTEGGYTIYTCSVCGDEYIGDETEPLEHDYEAVVTAPTCTAGGFTTYTCSVCGDEYIGDETEPLGHDYEAVVTAPTCTAGGFTTYTCAICGDEYVGDETEALGHNYEAVVTAPTCTEGGFTTYTCSACDDSYIADATEATGHTASYVDNGNGTHDATCSVCGETTVDDEAHTYTDGSCICGAQEPVELIEWYGSSSTLGGKLALNFYIESAKLSELTDAYVVITRTYADGSLDTKTIEQADWVKSGSYYKFTYSDIAAKEMGDVVSAVIYNANGTAVTVIREDSIATWALRVLDAYADEAETCTMCVDLLNYGAAAQTYFGYNAENLVNDALTDAQKALATAEAETVESIRDGQNLYGTSLVLEDEIQLKFYFNVAYAEGMTAKATFTDHYGNEKVVELEAVQNGTRTQVVVNALAIADYKSAVTCELYSAEGNVVAWGVDGMASNISRQVDEAWLVVCDAIMKLGASAYAYFH